MINSNKKSEDVLAAQSSTITRDKNFIKQTHNKFFYKKEECEKYLATKNQSNLYLFGEDSNSTLSKRFFITTYDLLYTLSSKKQYHLYEYFSENDMLKLHLDIDIKKKDIKENINFETIIDQCINLILDKLKQYNIVNPQIIILISSREDKCIKCIKCIKTINMHTITRVK